MLGQGVEHVEVLRVKGVGRGRRCCVGLSWPASKQSTNVDTVGTTAAAAAHLDGTWQASKVDQRGAQPRQQSQREAAGLLRAGARRLTCMEPAPQATTAMSSALASSSSPRVYCCRPSSTPAAPQAEGRGGGGGEGQA